MANIIGTVKEIIGTVKVVNEDGAVRIISKGDAIYENDSIEAMNSSQATIALNSGKEIVVDSENIQVMSEEYINTFDVVPDATDSQTTVADVEKLLNNDDTDTAFGQNSGRQGSVGSAYYHDRLNFADNDYTLDNVGFNASSIGGTLNGASATNTGNLSATDSDIPDSDAQNDAPEITITAQNNFTEDDGNAVGDIVASYTTADEDGDPVTVTLSDTTNYALDGNGNVTLTAAGLALVNEGTDLPSFTLTPNDGTDNGTPVTVDPSVTTVNDAPQSTNDTVNIVEDMSNTSENYTFKISDFGSYSDEEGSSLSSIKIESLPTNGELYLDGNLVNSGDVILVSDINNGKLIFNPADNSDENSSFNFKVSDGELWSQNSYTTSINIEADADTPNLAISDTNGSNGSSLLDSIPIADSVGLTKTIYSDIGQNGALLDSVNLETLTDSLSNGISTIVSEPYNSATDDSATDIAVDSVEVVKGLIYLEAGSKVSFSGYLDDSALIELGGKTLLHTTGDAYGSYDTSRAESISDGNGNVITSGDFVVARSGYYSLETYVYNHHGAGDMSINVTIDGVTTNLNSNILPLYTNISDVDTPHSAFVLGDEAGTDGGFYPVEVNKGIEGSDIKLSSITSSLNDTDGSEHLSLVISNIPSGATISDGTHTYTSPTNTLGEVSILGWNLDSLTLNVPNVDGNTTYTLNVTATATESSNSDTASQSLSFDVEVYDQDIHVNNVSGEVYESGIDVIGTDATSDTNILTGNLLTNQNATTYVSEVNGQVVENGVITVNTSYGELVVNSLTGEYTYTLLHPMTDIAGVDETENFTYTLSNQEGRSASAQIDINVVDDSPTAIPKNVSISVEPIITNLCVIVDSSGSMDNNDMTLTMKAINELVSKYSELGEVHINIVEFYSNNVQNSGWISSTDGISLYGTGSTDIYSGLYSVVNESFNGNQPNATQSVVYFFGDGDSNYNTSNFDSYLPTWSAFVTSGQIDKLFTYSVNTTQVLDDIVKVADNGENVVSDNAVNIDDINDLASAVSQTVSLYAEGNLTQTADGTTIINFGADGGHIASVTIGNNTVYYDEAHILQNVQGTYGTFEINFDTGEYRYVPSVNREYTESINASIVDNDGDSINSVLLNVHVNFDSSLNTFDGTIISENFDNNIDGWSSNASQQDGALYIEAGESVSKTFTINPNETATFTFDADTMGNWEGNDALRVYVNGTQTLVHYDDISGQQSFSFEAQADSNGEINLSFEADSSLYSEDLEIDNLHIDREYNLHDTLDSTTQTFSLSEEVSIDFDNVSNLPGAIENINKIDLTDTHAQSITLDAQDVLDVTDGNNVLEVLGGSNDSVTLEGSWTHTTDAQYNIYTTNINSQDITIKIDINIDDIVQS